MFGVGGLLQSYFLYRNLLERSYLSTGGFVATSVIGAGGQVVKNPCRSGAEPRESQRNGARVPLTVGTPGSKHAGSQQDYL